MKLVISALIASVLIAAMAHPSDDRASRSTYFAASRHAPAMVAQVLPGECCNDDFRQALPLSDYPLDTAIAKP